jgi:anion-transporting  ArsA/GET3 family ATPase
VPGRAFGWRVCEDWAVLERRLIVVSGKGGVGKSTIAAALGLLAARRGLRVIVVEVGAQRQVPSLLGHHSPPAAGEEVELSEGLWSLTIDTEDALREWISSAAGRLPARFLTSRSSFQYFAAAAPGAEEMLCMIKVSELTRRSSGRGRTDAYDLVILDAPATGHALAMLASPLTFTAIVRGGPMAAQAQQVRELLGDRQRSAYLAVTHASELAVSETLEFADALHTKLGREFEAIVVNGTVTRRFTAAELDRLAEVSDTSPVSERALAAARRVNDRARGQLTQIARLRRAELPLVRVPFRFTEALQRDSLEQIADDLERGL